ncbi:hypothetical protein GCM10010317_076540 [Streptomyces mirabilis]|uniref:hypothetical protein n=1 Tax=Streptomyces mirabilis TaxID=68239 RepID=UPI00167CD0E0|nr:hypothetical protein [Streptomyces mirabilis]GHD70062.1 hypothetical protein GCM10010317_076540 [Streptomyces mirabilis]
MDDQRYHLTLYAGARPVMHGWWGKRATADRKHAAWKREHGSVDGARIVLVDEETGSVLTIWPDEP